MTPAAQPGSAGSTSSAPTITSDARGSLTHAERKRSNSQPKRSRRSARLPLPRSGSPSTTTRVGSPPVWESTTLMRRMDLRSLLPAGEQSIQQRLEDQDGRAGDHREEDEEQEEVRLSA